MNIQLPVALKWVLTAVFFGWSCILAVVIIGDDTPDMPLSLFDFFLIKFMAIGAVYSTYKVGEWLYRRSYFPDIVCKYIEESAKDVEDEEL